MKKFVFGLVILANIAIFSTSCQKDRCPAHGQINQHEQVKRV